MPMSIGQDSDGTFNYEVHNGFEKIEAGKGYPTKALAEAAANVCFRELHRVNFVWKQPFFQNDYMSDEEIMAELESM